MRRILLLLAVMLLGACSTPPQIDSSLKSQLWLERQIAVGSINSWEIKGRVAVKNEKESGSATLHWSQSYANYELRLITPLGQGTYLLKGSSDGVTMHDPKNRVMMAKSAEKLLYEGLGWKLHLDGLKYWVRGIPEPYRVYSQLLLDEQGRLTYMKQSGFNVSILRYAEHGGVSLPEKLIIESDNIRLKLIIQNWNT